MDSKPTFRTVLEPVRGVAQIGTKDRITMLGSCFTDNVGSRLATDGFDVAINSMGILFNPASIAAVVSRALAGRPYTMADLCEHCGVWHCLELESRRQSADADALLSQLNSDFEAFARRLVETDVLIITFGTAWVFEYVPTGKIVGNCHKLDSRLFSRRRLSVDEIVEMWLPLLSDCRTIFTVSPIRHLADGLHGNQLSKATLQLSIDALGAEYFPAYEAVLDDLRDYRFYDADMKHPSAVAVDYIYSLFTDTYFTKDVMARALESRRCALRSNHRPIL